MIAGTTPLGDIVDRLTAEADLDTNRALIGDTTLDASGVTNPEADEAGDITVETFGNWTTGEYRVIHVAEDGTVGGVETNTDTISVKSPDSDSEPEPEPEPEDQAGFGAVIAVIALLAAALITHRRADT